MKKILIVVGSAVLILLVVGTFLSQVQAKTTLQQVFKDELTIGTKEQAKLTKEELIQLTNLSQIKEIEQVQITNLNELKTASPGKYQLKFLVRMRLGEAFKETATVEVQDNQAPDLQVKNGNTTKGESLTISDFAQATDLVDGSFPTKAVNYTGFDKNQVGKQIVTFKVQDSAGNLTSKQAEITVVAPQSSNGKKGASATAKETTPSEVKETIPSVAKESEVAATEASTTSETKQATEDTTTQLANDQSEKSKTSEETSASSEDQPKTVQMQPQLAHLTILGQTIPYIQQNGAGSAPASGAATWMGNGSVNDGAPTHFIGHNPGDFNVLLNVVVGDTITVVDDQNQQRTYHVYEVLDVTDEVYNAHDQSDDVYPRMLAEGGERISLQTCITDSVNRCVLAR